MPRTYKSKPGTKKIVNNSEESVNEAETLLLDSKISFRAASRKYNIPLGTLYNRVHGKHGMRKHGGQTVLSSEEERQVVENILLCSDWGFPLDREDVRMYVKMFLDSQGRTESRFVNNTPGSEWMANFLKRHRTELSMRIANNIKRSRANVDVQMLTKYHDNVSRTLAGIPPNAIFNFDETNLSDTPGAKKCIFRRGVKYPDRVINFTKSSITIMMCASANGVLLPPYVVYKSLHLYTSWTSEGPKGSPCCTDRCCKAGAQYNHTVSGWFDMSTFEHWFMNLFLPHASLIEGPKAVVCDNLSSHLSPLVLKEAKKNNIAFICLPPNSTHLSQPLDVAFFAPMKRTWSTILEEFKRSNPHKSVVDKTLFPRLLNKLLNHETFKRNIPANIKSGFRGTGLCPLNKVPLLNKLQQGKPTTITKSPTATTSEAQSGPSTSASPTRKNEPLSDDEETSLDSGWGNQEWDMNILEPLVEISDDPRDDSRKRKRKEMSGENRKRGRPSSASLARGRNAIVSDSCQSEFIDVGVSIKQEPPDSVPASLAGVSPSVPLAENSDVDHSMFQMATGGLTMILPQPHPLVLQAGLDYSVQNTNNLLINQQESRNSPGTSQNASENAPEVASAAKVKEEQVENVFVMPFGRDVEASSNKQFSPTETIVGHSLQDTTQKNRTSAIAASIGVGGMSANRKLRDLTFRLVELNNKTLQCDSRIEKIKEEFKKRLQVAEIEKKGIEQEIERVLSSIQDWKDARKQLA